MIPRKSSPRLSQPQGASSIDWSNPLARGLVFATATPGYGNGQELSGSGFSTARSPRGVGLMTGPTNTAVVLLPQQIVADIAGKPITCFWVCDPPSLQTGGFSNHLFAVRDGVTQSLIIGNNNATNGFQIVLGGVAAGFLAPSQYDFSTSFAVVADGTNLVGYAGSTSATQAFTSLPTASTIRPSLMNRTTGGRGSSIPTHMIAIYNRALTPAEIATLTANPWQLFRSPARIIPFVAATVTLPTLVQPASTTTAGGWTPVGAASLHAAINESVPSSAEYITVNSASTCEMVLAESAYPGTATQTLAYRASSTSGSTLTVTLKQGGTTIMTRSHALTSTDTLYTQTLTAPEIASIVAGPISVTLAAS